MTPPWPSQKKNKNATADRNAAANAKPKPPTKRTDAPRAQTRPGPTAPNQPAQAERQTTATAPTTTPAQTDRTHSRDDAAATQATNHTARTAAATKRTDRNTTPATRNEKDDAPREPPPQTKPPRQRDGPPPRNAMGGADASILARRCGGVESGKTRRLNSWHYGRGRIGSVAAIWWRWCEAKNTGRWRRFDWGWVVGAEGMSLALPIASDMPGGFPMLAWGVTG